MSFSDSFPVVFGAYVFTHQRNEKKKKKKREREREKKKGTKKECQTDLILDDVAIIRRIFLDVNTKSMVQVIINGAFAQHRNLYCIIVIVFFRHYFKRLTIAKSDIMRKCCDMFTEM